MNPSQALREEATRQIKDELVESVVYSSDRSFSKLQVAQVARAYNIPLEIAEQIAGALVQQQLGIDLETVDFHNTIKQISEIENTIDDQGLRVWKLQALAKRSHRTYRELMECYNKALLNQESLKPMSLKQLREQTETETRWLIPGWLPLGTNLLFFGDGGTGKTLMTYQWLEAIATGRKWNGYQVEQGRCLLVQCDEPEIVLRNRMDLMQLDDDSPIDIITDWSTDAIPRLRTYIEENRPKFILIDSLSAVNKSCMFSENDMEYARPILQLTQLCSEFNVTICLIHHSNAMGQARGTRAIHNSVSEVWALRHGDNPSERVLAVQKTRLGRAPGNYRFGFDEDSLGFEYLGHADDPDGVSATQEEKVRLWMYQDENRSRPYTPIEVAEQCAISQPSTRKVLQELWGKGLISRRPSKTGKRGYVYFSPAISSAYCDPAILTPDPRIATKDRSPNSDSTSDSAVRDPAIPLFSKCTVEISEKQGSQDRSQPQPIQGVDLLRIDHNDPSSGKDRKKRGFEPQKTATVANPLQRGTQVEVLIEGSYTPGILVKLRDRMIYSKRLQRLTDAYEVMVNGKKLTVPSDYIRPLEE